MENLFFEKAQLEAALAQSKHGSAEYDELLRRLFEVMLNLQEASQQT